MQKIECDRCKALANAPNNPREQPPGWGQAMIRIDTDRENHDLCGECTGSLTRFLSQRPGKPAVRTYPRGGNLDGDDVENER